jgi:hypothetical protein
VSRKLSPEENRIIDLINQITSTREVLKRRSFVPEFIESEHAEAQSYAEKALKSFRAGDAEGKGLVLGGKRLSRKSTA